MHTAMISVSGVFSPGPPPGGLPVGPAGAQLTYPVYLFGSCVTEFLNTPLLPHEYYKVKLR